MDQATGAPVICAPDAFRTTAVSAVVAPIAVSVAGVAGETVTDVALLVTVTSNESRRSVFSGLTPTMYVEPGPTAVMVPAVTRAIVMSWLLQLTAVRGSDTPRAFLKST
ncbi:MAG TPA: hypothetical protein VEB19_19340, partial [Gemmatimonadaceae bacterium]|nr:hypothetical protein [Gemmatimonadaceae bacterium]